jgi:valyl-tRNA synthetase
MELSKNFDHQSADNNWYQHWLNKGYFNSTPDEREAYTIVIPPPNVTGVLHMGHCLNNTIQDILIRRARMQGKNACWVPGTDHASIATEAKVVAMLRERGIAKSSLSRDEFLQYAWEWKEKYGGIILQQLKKLGCSLDWNRTSFTMDDDYYKSVIKVFIDLHKKGIIYRGLRMVNWDPASKTALSDEEVIFKEIDSKLYYVKYPLADDSNKFMMVATTRPETILGDVAICVNPTDERYAAWIGKEVIVPIINRRVPIIADEYVDAEFGTGALKITPAHDKNDNEIGRKHNLKSLNTLDESGKFTAVDLMDENPSELVLSYNGVDRFELRKQIVEDIKALGQIEKIEYYKGQVGTSERTGAVIESRLSLQWFMNMKEFLNRNPETLSSVMNDEIKFHPEKTKNTYNHWLSNIKDWCISRQLWWGQQIPAWYDEEGNYVVAASKEEAIAQFNIQHPTSNTATIKQDEDCLDTWFSSWLWPMEVFKGISNPGNKDAEYYYPTTTLVTGQDIIFFWVARMIMAGYEYKKEQPFKDVYFTGMVRDKQGRKMSKQLGNSPDLLELIDKYGADAVRFGIMFSSPAGNDLMFDESSLEQGRNFNNKLWNALKLVKMWEGRYENIDFNTETDVPSIRANETIEWFDSRFKKVKIEVDELLETFKLSEALQVIYNLIWDDFCSRYLELIKPEVNNSVIKKTKELFENIITLLHPFMPFITEEIYQKLLDRDDNDSICIKQINIEPNYDESILDVAENTFDILTTARDLKSNLQIKKTDKFGFYIKGDAFNFFKSTTEIITGATGSFETKFITEPPNETYFSSVTETTTVYVVISGNESKSFIDEKKKEQKAELEKDLAYQKGFLESVMKKLGNERFVANAKPEVIAAEQKKKADAEARIKTIEESLANL